MKQYITLMIIGLSIGWLYGSGYNGQSHTEQSQSEQGQPAQQSSAQRAKAAGFASRLSIWSQADAAWGAPKKLKKGDMMPSDLFIRLAKKVNPAVVNISIVTPRRSSFSRRDPFFDLFEPFMGPNFRAPNLPQAPQASPSGTGFIIRPDGLILTNAHVVAALGPQAQIHIQLSDDKKIYKAQRIGHDKQTDVALIKIKSEKLLPFVKLGKSNDLEVGEWVAAFGNPFGQSNTLTVGVVSFIGREIKQINKVPLIQTDASINPGNSGGPLVNINGEAIGVNAAIDARAQGIGFAIPVDGIIGLLPQLEKYGTIQRGFLGVYMQDINLSTARALKLPNTKGALIAQVSPRGPASRAGIRPYDFIVKFGKHEVRGSADLSRVVQDSRVGEPIELELIRQGKKKTLTVRLEPIPGSQPTRSAKPKTYRGQKAPFDLGFYVANWSAALKREFSLPPLPRAHPVVIELDVRSRAAQAGLRVGDVILDVNQKLTTRATQVLQYLQAKQANILRVQRGNRAYLIYIP